MLKNVSGKQSIEEMSIDELKDLERTLERKLYKAKFNCNSSEDLIKSLTKQLLKVSNRITALKIQN